MLYILEQRLQAQAIVEEKSLRGQYKRWSSTDGRQRRDGGRSTERRSSHRVRSLFVAFLSPAGCDQHDVQREVHQRAVQASEDVLQHVHATDLRPTRAQLHHETQHVQHGQGQTHNTRTLQRNGKAQAHGECTDRGSSL